MTGETSGNEEEQRSIGREAAETREARQKAREAHRETLRRKDEEDAPQAAEQARLQRVSPNALVPTNERDWTATTARGGPATRVRSMR